MDFSDLLDVIYAKWVNSFGVMVDIEEVRKAIDQQLAEVTDMVEASRNKVPSKREIQDQLDLMSLMPAARRREDP